MPKGGLEPPCPFEHNALNVACLPISPLRLALSFVGCVLFPAGDRDYITGFFVNCQGDLWAFLPLWGKFVECQRMFAVDSSDWPIFRLVSSRLASSRLVLPLAMPVQDEEMIEG